MSAKTGVYRNLHTNLPKELMAFPDLEFEEDSKSFTHHSNISKYLEQYAEKFDLKKVNHIKSCSTRSSFLFYCQHIQFETEVVDVSPANPGDKEGFTEREKMK